LLEADLGMFNVDDSIYLQFGRLLQLCLQGKNCALDNVIEHVSLEKFIFIYSQTTKSRVKAQICGVISELSTRQLLLIETKLQDNMELFFSRNGKKIFLDRHFAGTMSLVGIGRKFSYEQLYEVVFSDSAV